MQILDNGVEPEYVKLKATGNELPAWQPGATADSKLVLKADVIPADKNLIEPFKPNRHQRRKHRADQPQRKQKHNVKTRMAAYCNILTAPTEVEYKESK